MIQEDRRTRKTRAHIQLALEELLATKEITRISVKELCEKADIGRTTFYKYYTNASDVIEKWCSDFLLRIKNFASSFTFDEIITRNDIKMKSLISEYVLGGGDKCDSRFLVYVVGTLDFMSQIKRTIVEAFYEKHKNVFPADFNFVKVYFFINFYVSGIVDSISVWLTYGQKLISFDELMDGMLDQIYRGTDAVYKDVLLLLEDLQKA